jgi:hypothetical protein
MELAKYILGGALLLFGLFIVVTNYARQISNFRSGKKENGRWSSPAPLVGPLFTIIGYLILPFEFSGWILLVIVLDPDTVITILGIPYLIKALRE